MLGRFGHGQANVPGRIRSNRADVDPSDEPRRKRLKEFTKRLPNLLPRHSMYVIFTYIGVASGANVGIYMPYMECLG